jgi:hypothetical protein
VARLIGSGPARARIADNAGSLYGTGKVGGSGGGTVFRITFLARFAGIPGEPKRVGQSVSTPAKTYAGIAAAATTLGYASVTDLQNALRATVDHSSSGLGIVANGNCHVPSLNRTYPPTGQGLYFGAAQSGESPRNYLPEQWGAGSISNLFLACFNCRPPFSRMATCMRYTRVNIYWAPLCCCCHSCSLISANHRRRHRQRPLAKDMTESATFARRLEVVEVGIGQDGDSKTTCVIVFAENGAVDNAAEIKAKFKKLAPQAVTALKAIRQ